MCFYPLQPQDKIPNNTTNICSSKTKAAEFPKSAAFDSECEAESEPKVKEFTSRHGQTDIFLRRT